jgi:hypothetical protein
VITALCLQRVQGCGLVGEREYAMSVYGEAVLCPVHECMAWLGPIDMQCCAPVANTLRRRGVCPLRLCITGIWKELYRALPRL